MMTTTHTSSSSSSSFDSRKQQETLVGRKRTKQKASTQFKDAERRKCAKTVLPDTQRLITLVQGFKQKLQDESTDQWTMWHLQLKMAMEMVQIAAKVLVFLEQVAELEELSMDIETDMIPLIGEMICDCQDTISDAAATTITTAATATATATTTTTTTSSPKESSLPLLPLWTRDTERDEKTVKQLDLAIESMSELVSTVFKSKTWIKAKERFHLLHACCDLFQASEDLVKSAVGDGEFIELNERLESIFEDAISKCDDQTMDEYVDVDYDCNDDDEEEDD